MLRACALTARIEITACARPSAGIFGDFGSPVITRLGEVAIFSMTKNRAGVWVLPGSKCPLWVISGHLSADLRCPLYPQERTIKRMSWHVPLMCYNIGHNAIHQATFAVCMAWVARACRANRLDVRTRACGIQKQPKQCPFRPVWAAPQSPRSRSSNCPMDPPSSRDADRLRRSWRIVRFLLDHRAGGLLDSS